MVKFIFYRGKKNNENPNFTEYKEKNLNIILIFDENDKLVDGKRFISMRATMVDYDVEPKALVDFIKENKGKTKTEIEGLNWGSKR